MTIEEINKLADEAWENHWKNYFLNQEILLQPIYADFRSGFLAAFDSMQPAPAPAKKKTITLYQAVFKSDFSNVYYIKDDLYESEFEAIDANKKGFVKLLTDRPIEIEVEE